PDQDRGEQGEEEVVGELRGERGPAVVDELLGRPPGERPPGERTPGEPERDHGDLPGRTVWPAGDTLTARCDWNSRSEGGARARRSSAVHPVCPTSGGAEDGVAPVGPASSPARHASGKLEARGRAGPRGEGGTMARRVVVLVTGAGGELGHGLVHRLADAGTAVLGLDLRPLDPEVAGRCAVTLVGDIRDRHLLERLRSEFEIHTVFHLAAILSTRAEFIPESAHQVNVEGTLNLLGLAMEEARWQG